MSAHANTRPDVEAAGKVLVQWAIWHFRMQEIARRPWALIDGERAVVVFHDPGAVR